ncbi:MAG: ParB/RepB/Spo0J family partition protein, partial [Oscillospiraceae bacterium]
SGGGYQIVAGERRWRACRMLGLSEIPVVIREFSDEETAQVALIENLQRENLNPIEEANGYRDLMHKYKMTQEQVSKIVGKSRSVVANALRLLNLPEEIQGFLRNGEISTGHAKALAGIDDAELMIDTARKAAGGFLTVRAVEKIASKPDFEEENDGKTKDTYFKEIEISLKNELGRKVKVNFSNNKGMLQVEFFDKNDLGELANRLAGTK